ncbi:hypothetical protein HanRHA438_Chr11g0486911 [Helianthus annuus]|uniref:Uncharacterized protein n=1 Tax=Helianthus annuus TaxID=4232 RepID=A0A9K3HLE2_HELAN|nr:uncharacterized protein LOC110887774 [Helianthus annuus]KAF5780571.1 hypothetical protein HanXRQr2_Chr11g0473421 [Helianthus annuus]KAJ0869233.1 hypothetical protein HanRHA438_Chr11g0486911 [Helianthus annuus]KAJ0873787.1 hypothetical protein HanPSC8_Chr11g0456531 [Helianthus annuus]
MVLHSTERQGRDGSGGGSGGSSIVLLQERFRQLQRMREKRQEMELLKLFPEHGTTSRSGQTNRYEPPVRSLVHPEMMKTRPCSQDSVSLGLDLSTKQAEPQKPAKNTQFMDFWKVDSNKHEVDTSLHL